MVSHFAQVLSCIRSLGLVVPDRTAWFVVLSLLLSCVILLLLLLKRLRLARQQLRQHEARGRALFENAIDAILTADADTGMLLDANARAQALLGWSLDEIRSMHHTQLYLPEERELANERFVRSTEAPAESLVQLHVVTAAGRQVPVEISSGGAAMVAGRRVLIGIFRDVSERIAREEEFRRQQARLDSIFRAAPVGIGVVVNRVFTEVNDTLCRMVGYSREEMIGRCSRFLYPTQEDFEYVGAVKYGRIARQGTGTVETRWRCKDGTILEILLSSTPIEPSDLSRGVTFTALDITKRKEAEQALRRSERRFQSLFDAMTEMVVLHEVVCDDAGNPVDYRILDCNPAFTRIMGIPRQQAVGSLASRLYAGSDAAFRESYFRVAAGGEPQPVEAVPTPETTTIEAVAAYLGVPTSQTLKAVFYTTAEGEVIFVVIRGDLSVNEVKLANLLGGTTLRPATEDELRQTGIVAGYASPVGARGVRVIADDSVRTGVNWIAGANRSGYHLRNVNYPRDFQADVVADIALAREGLPCPRCGEILCQARGIEVGHLFKLGTRYSAAVGATFLDQNGEAKPVVMGSYGIGTGRLMAAIVEQHHDDKGIIWPPSVAPFQVHLVSLGLDRPEVAGAADALYAELRHAGIEVLYDDRLESAGVKFNDADLIGVPLRLTISPRTLRAEAIEAKLRWETQVAQWPRAEVAHRVRDTLAINPALP